MWGVCPAKATESAKGSSAAYRSVFSSFHTSPHSFSTSAILAALLSCVPRQGVRMGETSTNVANVNMAQGLKIRVEEGCDLADPCDSNICPDNSHCSDDWSAHTCVCDPGTTPPPGRFSRCFRCSSSRLPLVPQVILGRSVWTLVCSTHVNMFPPAFANPAPPTATPVNVGRTSMASTAKTSRTSHLHSLRLYSLLLCAQRSV